VPNEARHADLVQIISSTYGFYRSETLSTESAPLNVRSSTAIVQTGIDCASIDMVLSEIARPAREF
jgi:hypothetical protein